MKTALLVVALLLTSREAPGQRMVMDPDWCWTCRDSREHFAAGAGINLAAHVVLPKSTLVQRLLITVVIASAYELGQEEMARYGGPRGPGYGFGTKDLLIGVAGAVSMEILWEVLR